MFHRITLTAAAALLAAGPALAGSLAPPIVVAAPAAPVVVPVAPVVVASNDWSGFYVGGNLAYGQLRTNREDDAETPLFDEEIADEKSGPLLGAHIGYMYDFGRFVAGVEGSYAGADFTEGEDNFDGDLAGPTTTVDSVSRLGVRLGYDAGRILPYVTAGISNVDLTVEGPDGDDVDADNDLFDDSVSGSFLGAGVEYMVSDRFFVGAEVARYNIDVEDSEGVFVGLEDMDTELTTIGVRASYKF